MPRNYKPKAGARQRVKHSDLQFAKATAAKMKGKSYREVGKQFGIDPSVLYRHIRNPALKNVGGRSTVLNEDVEASIAEKLIVCGTWGYPLGPLDLKVVVKGYLDRRGIQEARFKQNLPGDDWVNGFMKRHKALLSPRICQNIKRSRAAVSHDAINSFFDELALTLGGVPPSNIVNYDETNLTDDPGKKRVIVKRGTKYPERIMNSSKASTSIMFAGTASGTLLPSYVVYKAKNMHDVWTMGGPRNTRYNRTCSGWFDLDTFTDWFMKVALPYLKTLTGRKVLIGDNLASHLSVAVIEECEKNDISFVFLPANSTHITQPLDVAFFRPLKASWRKILSQWKNSEGRKKASVPKDTFPALLSKLEQEIRVNAENNLKAGFEKCGLVPMNRDKILDRIPNLQGAAEHEIDKESTVDSSILTVLNEMRFGNSTEPPKKKKKLAVAPGKSVLGCDLNKESDQIDSDSGEEAKDNARPSSSVSQASAQAQPSPALPTTHSAATLKGVTEIAKTNIGIGKWLLVDFSPSTTKKNNLYLGKVISILKNGDFEATFTRSTFRSSGNTFSFPTLEDKSVFNFTQVIGAVADPEEMRRGIFKFNVNSTLW